MGQERIETEALRANGNYQIENLEMKKFHSIPY
jgi:hypothetical protein